MDMTPQAWPDWYDGRHINEVLFCQQFPVSYTHLDVYKRQIHDLHQLKKA